MSYVNSTLEMGRGEQRARFNNEFSLSEKREFAVKLLQIYRDAGIGIKELLSHFPEMGQFIPAGYQRDPWDTD